MEVTIKKGKLEGEVLAPPSKSVAHRLLISAFISGNKYNIKNVELSEDIKATIGAISSLGAQCIVNGNTVQIETSELKKYATIDCNESGSTLRFMLPIAISVMENVKLVGAKKLFERPLNIYEDILNEQGIPFKKGDNFIEINGKLKPTDFKVAGNISSQFISGLIFSLSVLKGGSVTVIEPFESKPYVDLTVDALEKFGIYIENIGNTYTLKQIISKSDRTLEVDGDYSNAANLDAFNLVGGNVKVKGLAANSLQGDKVYKEYFELLKFGTPTLDISQCPDLGPILIAVAAINHGAKLVGTKRLKIKESDRGNVMKAELEKCGINLQVLENEIIVPNGIKGENFEFNSHNDHRIVMALSLILSKYGGKILGASAVNKSYPSYFEVLKELGSEVEIKNEDN